MYDQNNAAAETGTGTAAAKTEEEHSTFEKDQTIDFKTSTEAPAAPAFGAFRDWLSREIQRHPATIDHAGVIWTVEDVTHDGKLRLTRGSQTVMLTLADPYIPALLKQVLPRE